MNNEIDRHCYIILNNDMVVDGIENLDVDDKKKSEMEMELLVRMGFSKKYKENLLRKKIKYRLNFMLRKIKRFFYVRKKENALMHFLEYRKMIRKKMEG